MILLRPCSIISIHLQENIVHMFPMNQWHFSDFDEQVFQRVSFFIHVVMHSVDITEYLLCPSDDNVMPCTHLAVEFSSSRTGAKCKPVALVALGLSSRPSQYCHFFAMAFNRHIIHSFNQHLLGQALHHVPGI